MRPYAHGRNRDSDHVQRATLLGRTSLYLRLFYSDIKWLWSECEMPGIFKAMGTVLLLLIMNLPVIFFIFCVFSTLASIRLLTLDPNDWTWRILDPLAIIDFRVTPRDMVSLKRLARNLASISLFMLSFYDHFIVDF